MRSARRQPREQQKDASLWIFLWKGVCVSPLPGIVSSMATQREKWKIDSAKVEKEAKRKREREQRRKEAGNV